MPTSTPHPGQCGQNTLRNAGFEAGLPGTPWQQYSSGGYQLINQERPRSGTWGTRLGGYNNALDRLYQGFTIPSGATQATLTFWWYMTSSDSVTTPYDYLEIVLQSPLGNTLTGPHQIKNTDARGAWYQRSITYTGLGPWAGQPMWLFIEAKTDSSLITTFFLDDVSFVIQCGGASGADTGNTFTSPLTPP